ncbi:MAG: hypothetical protein MJZ20_03085 [Bacteroidaceae bacterium]|nr:hypothetical protein [Bacteroidaceae bacterium]
MAYDFEKLSEVSSLDEFPEGAKVLIEHDGDIKRCAADGLGGGGGYHFIYLDMDVQTYEITCDEEITFESLREDVANGIMPVAIMDATEEGESSSMSIFAAMPFAGIQDFVNDYEDEHYEEHVALFGGAGEMGVFLVYEDGQYIWQMGG